RTYHRTHFLGPKTRSAVATKLRANDFAIFYPIESDPNLEIPLEIPLTMGYRSSEGILHEFPLRFEFGRWSVVFGNKQMPEFQTIASLIDYYRTYSYINAQTGEVEILPVWNTNAGDSSDDSFGSF
ncbi:hypothetical protein Tcan_08505, partial [Toxocara canis]